MFKAEVVRRIWESVISNKRRSGGLSAWRRLNAAGSSDCIMKDRHAQKEPPSIGGFKGVWRAV